MALKFGARPQIRGGYLYCSEASGVRFEDREFDVDGKEGAGIRVCA